MRPRYFPISIFSLSIFVAIAVLFAACAKPTSTAVQADLPSDIPKVLAETVEAGVKDSPKISLTAETTVPQVTPYYEGQSLLDQHCTQCHLAQSIVRMKKSRADWEKILELMEGMGAHLDETEKVILLDYLTATDEP